MNRKRAGARRLQNPSLPDDILTKINIQVWRSHVEWMDKFIPNQSEFFRDFVTHSMAAQAIPHENVDRQFQILHEESEFHRKKMREHEEGFYKKQIEIFALLKTVDINEFQDAQIRAAADERVQTLMEIVRGIPGVYNLVRIGNQDAAVAHIQSICKQIPPDKIRQFFKKYDDVPTSDVIREFFQEWVK